MAVKDILAQANPNAENQALRQALLAATARVIDHGHYILGRRGRALRKKRRQLFGCQTCDRRVIGQRRAFGHTYGPRHRCRR